MRFSHIADKIFDNLDNDSLVTCRLVNKTWFSFIEDSKLLWLRIIKTCTGNQVFWKVIVEKAPTDILKELSKALIDKVGSL